MRWFARAMAFIRVVVFVFTLSCLLLLARFRTRCWLAVLVEAALACCAVLWTDQANARELLGLLELAQSEELRVHNLLVCQQRLLLQLLVLMLPLALRSLMCKPLSVKLTTAACIEFTQTCTHI